MIYLFVYILHYTNHDLIKNPQTIKLTPIVKKPFFFLSFKYLIKRKRRHGVLNYRSINYKDDHQYYNSVHKSSFDCGYSQQNLPLFDLYMQSDSGGWMLNKLLISSTLTFYVCFLAMIYIIELRKKNKYFLFKI